MATVEETIDAKVKAATDLYETFREDGGEFCDQASGLALATHGLRMQEHIAGEALARAVEYVRSTRAPMNEAYQGLFESARARAFERLGNDRRKATDYEIGLVVGIHARHRESLEIWHQVDRDLRTYPLYDALAMWMGPETGLAAGAPEMMAEVAELFL